MPIVFDRVSFSYNPAKRHSGATCTWALHNLSFTIDEGTITGIAGHTGSGKSTLISLLCALLTPQEGTILLDGENLSDKHVARRAPEKIAILFQHSEHQLFAQTVFEDIAFGPRNLGLSEDAVRERVLAALANVHLPEDLLTRNPFDLSGGQQRRVALAGILAMRPRYLVLDEPAAGLDPISRLGIENLVRSLKADGVTIIMVSHDMSSLAEVCDTLIVLKSGEMLMCGTPQDVFLRRDLLDKAGLDVPAAQKLACSLQAHGIPLSADTQLFTLQSLSEALCGLKKVYPAQPSPASPAHPTTPPEPQCSCEHDAAKTILVASTYQPSGGVQ